MFSKERAPRFKPDIPGPTRWRIVKNLSGTKLARQNEITADGADIVRMRGPEVSVSNHRNNETDVKVFGWVLRKRRTPYMPAKDELDEGYEAWFMKGSGALFFDRDNAESRAQVYDQMTKLLAAGRYLHIFLEETSKNRGRQLGGITHTPVSLAMEAGLDRIVLAGIGGTEDENSRKLHVEFGELSLDGLKELVELKRDMNANGQKITAREVSALLAQTENVPMLSDDVLFEIVNPDNRRRRGQRRLRAERNPAQIGADRMLIYKVFTEQVLRRALQGVVDIAYDKATPDGADTIRA